MLLNARLLVQEREKNTEHSKLYGQEINIITSAIARMNMFIHGVQDFEIVQGDTLKRPEFIENGTSQTIRYLHRKSTLFYEEVGQGILEE